MRNPVKRIRSWALPLALLALTATNVVLTFERPRVAQANFSDAVLFDHREYWERVLTQVWPAIANANNPWPLSILFTSNDSIACDCVLPQVWSLQQQVLGGFPAAKRALWMGEDFEACQVFSDPFGPWNAAESPTTSQDHYGATVGLWSRLSIMESIVAIDSINAGSLSVGNKMGFALGHMDTLAFPINASGNFFSKRSIVALYARPDNNTWELLVNKGTTGSTRTQGKIVVLTGVDPPRPARMIRLRLVYNPVAKYIAAVVNGVEGARITDVSKFPACDGTDLVGQTNTGFCVFAMSGPQVGGIMPQVNMAFWYPTIRTYYTAP